MKLQIKQQNGEVTITGETVDGITVCFVRDSVGRHFIRIFADQMPKRAIRVSIKRFFRGKVVEDFLPANFIPVEQAPFFLERNNFPEDLFADLRDEKATVTIGWGWTAL